MNGLSAYKVKFRKAYPSTLVEIVALSFIFSRKEIFLNAEFILGDHCTVMK
jgi:hypothetical protein